MASVWCEKTEGSDDESVAGKRADKHFPHIHWRDVISKVKICVSHLVIAGNYVSMLFSIMQACMLSLHNWQFTGGDFCELSILCVCFIYLLFTYDSISTSLSLWKTLESQDRAGINTMSERCSHLKGGAVSIQCLSSMNSGTSVELFGAVFWHISF